MKRFWIIIILLLCLGSYTAQAQVLEDYLKEAAESNPTLKASFYEYMAAVEEVPQVGSLPDPQLTFGYFIKPMELPMGNQRAELSFMQMFPWFGMLRTQKTEAAYMAKAKYQLFQESKNQLFFEVKSTWYQLYELEAEIQLTKENLEIMRSYERLALVRIKSGGTGNATESTSGRSGMGSRQSSGTTNSMSSGGSMGGMNQPSAGNTRSSGNTRGSMPSSSMSSGGSMADVLRVQMEIKEMENKLALLQDSQAPLVVKFNKLLNKDIDATVKLADTLTVRPLPATELALLDSIIQSNPMVKMLEAEQQAFESQKKMAKLGGRPMFGAGLNYMILSPLPHEDMKMGGDNMVMPMVSMTLPIYRKKYKSAVKEAELLQEATISRQKSVENQLTVQLKDALRNLKDTERRLQLYHELETLANQTLRLLITSYSTQGTNFEEVLRVQQQLIDYRLQMINAVVDQNITVAMIEMLAASGLDTNELK